MIVTEIDAPCLATHLLQGVKCFFFLISRSQQVCGQSLWIEKYLSVSHAVGTNQVCCDLFCLYKCLFCHGFLRSKLPDFDDIMHQFYHAVRASEGEESNMQQGNF